MKVFRTNTLAGKEYLQAYANAVSTFQYDALHLVACDVAKSNVRVGDGFELYHEAHRSYITVWDYENDSVSYIVVHR